MDGHLANLLATTRQPASHRIEGRITPKVDLEPIPIAQGPAIPPPEFAQKSPPIALSTNLLQRIPAPSRLMCRALFRHLPLLIPLPPRNTPFPIPASFRGWSP